MMSATLPLTLLGIVGLGLLSCRGDETISAYGAADVEWRLYELDGNAFTARATLSFPEPGRIVGRAPCNTFNGNMDAPYPWFEAEQLSLTQRSCQNIAAEEEFLSALRQMTLSEVSGDVLILSNTDGREMVFKAAE